MHYFLIVFPSQLACAQYCRRPRAIFGTMDPINFLSVATAVVQPDHARCAGVKNADRRYRGDQLHKLIMKREPMIN